MKKDCENSRSAAAQVYKSRFGFLVFLFYFEVSSSCVFLWLSSSCFCPFSSFFLCFIFSLALVSLCVLCVAALLFVAPGLPSVLFSFVLALGFACLLLFEFWILNSVAHHYCSLHLVTSCLPLSAIHHVCKPKQSQHVKLRKKLPMLSC